MTTRTAKVKNALVRVFGVASNKSLEFGYTELTQLAIWLY